MGIQRNNGLKTKQKKVDITRHADFLGIAGKREEGVRVMPRLILLKQGIQIGGKIMNYILDMLSSTSFWNIPGEVSDGPKEISARGTD